jgi:hypothetical protein
MQRWGLELSLLLFAACGDGGDDATPIPTPTTSVTPAIVETPTPAPSECDCFPYCVPVTCEPVALRRSAPDGARSVRPSP